MTTEPEYSVGTKVLDGSWGDIPDYGVVTHVFSEVAGRTTRYEVCWESGMISTETEYTLTTMITE